MRTIKKRNRNPAIKADICPELFAHNLSENEKDETGVWFFPNKKGRGSYTAKHRLNIAEGECKIFLTKKIIGDSENYDYELNKVLRFNYTLFEIETIVLRRGHNSLRTGVRKTKKSLEFTTEKIPFGVMGWRTKVFDFMEGCEKLHNLINSSDQIDAGLWNKTFKELIKNSFIGSVSDGQINIY